MKDYEYDLEEIVDKIGIKDTISTLSQIAYEKADHLRTNWQDENGAKIWEKIGSILDKTRGKLDEVI